MGEEGVLTFQETVQGTHLESYFISYQSLAERASNKNHLPFGTEK